MSNNRSLSNKPKNFGRRQGNSNTFTQAVKLAMLERATLYPTKDPDRLATRKLSIALAKEVDRMIRDWQENGAARLLIIQLTFDRFTARYFAELLEKGFDHYGIQAPSVIFDVTEEHLIVRGEG